MPNFPHRAIEFCRSNIFNSMDEKTAEGRSISYYESQGILIIMIITIIIRRTRITRVIITLMIIRVICIITIIVTICDFDVICVINHNNYGFIITDTDEYILR